MHLLLGLLIKKRKEEGKWMISTPNTTPPTPYKREAIWDLCQEMRRIVILFGLCWNAFERCKRRKQSGGKHNSLFTSFLDTHLLTLRTVPQEGRVSNVKQTEEARAFEMAWQDCLAGAPASDDGCRFHGNCKCNWGSPVQQLSAPFVQS